MLARRFALILGLFLIIEGVWGLFSPVVFGVLTTNTLHAVIHIALGVLGILAGRGMGTRNYLLGVGALLVLVGALRFVPGARELVISLLNVNVTVAWFNIVVGAICLAIGSRAPRSSTVPPSVA
jgi:hypothetical protein